MANLIKRAWNHKATGVGALVVLGLVVIVVIAGIVLSFVAPVKPGAQGAQPSGAAPVQTDAPTADAGACSVPVGDTSFRPKLPSDLRWAAAQGLTWPVSAAVGPTKSKDGFPVCFARSPLGAALFETTATYLMWTSANPRGAVDAYVLDSPGKSVFKNGATPGSSQKIAQAGWTAAGFIVDAFTPDEAQITVVFSTPGSQSGYTGFPYTVVWKDGSWHIKVLDSGATWTGSPSAPVKGQFVEWGGSNG
ncbi:hypothetical protein ABH924_004615 [Arthrobacter sp. GAS37]|uniref:hypothetical protein n=1 Tax=Arthrobacter sp. GAS37 TaxID=3156261 RepID=UPI003838A94A